jgi:hypothetical protein
MVLVKNQTWDTNGNLLFEEEIEVPYPSLSGYQVMAALNAALGIWSLEDASNVAGVSAEHLEAEVLAWGFNYINKEEP